MIFSQHAILRSSKLLVLVIAFTAFAFLSGSSRGCAQDGGLLDTMGPSGSVRAGYWQRDKSYEDDRNYAVGSLWLNLRPQEVGGFKFFVDGYTQGQDLTRKRESKSDLREFYVERGFGDFDLKVGRMITVWGRADKLNPTDNLSMKRLGVLSVDDEDQRTGLSAAQLTYNIDAYRLIGVWQPDWRASEFPVKKTMGVSITEVKPDRPQDQFALKLDNSGGAVDWSVSTYRGYNKIPNLRVASIGPAGIDLDMVYERIDVYGADAAMNVGDVAARAEVAFTRSLEEVSFDEVLKQKNQLYAVVGADRNFAEGLNLNAQLLYKQIYGFQDTDRLANPFEKALAQQVQLNSNQLASQQYGFSVRPSYKLLNETLEVELAWVEWLTVSSRLIRPKLVYAASDHVKLSAGSETYMGGEETYFGRLKDLSTGFAEVRYGF